MIAEITIDETKRPSDRIAAAKIIIEYGCGKPKETIDNNVTVSESNIKDLLSFGATK